jgi:S-DNA-T family DNA segregation ATPase FtsK/SpoIIIE
MSKFGARGLEAFNEIVSKLSGPEIAQHEKFQSELTGAARLDDYYYEAQPYLVIVVEEFGDLMAVDKSNVENSVVRLAQMARACGIHLILAMQSPRRDVVTGLIKTNIPGRVSFKVASKMDSRIILDESGAERLLTRGDMLYLAPGVAKPERHHGAYVSEAELGQLTEHWATQSEPVFDPLAMKILEGNGGGYDLSDEIGGTQGTESEFDDRYDEILAYVAGLKEISASLIQRRFRIGYPRAARLIEMFEAEGVIGPSSGSKPRQVLVGPIA